jgi:hypothetical protein
MFKNIIAVYLQNQSKGIKMLSGQNMWIPKAGVLRIRQLVKITSEF